MSLRELSRRSELSVSFLSRIENGTSIPTVMTLQKLCYALDIDMVDFLTSESSKKKRKFLFKRDDMKLVEGEGRHWYFTFPSESEFKVSQTYEEYEPFTSLLEKEKHPVDIFGFVISGQLSLKIGKDELFVKEGDAFYIPANQEHIASNQSKEVLKMIVGRVKDK